MLRSYLKKIAVMQKRTILTLGTSAIALFSLFISGCYPVFLQESKRADARPEYVTKYFAVKPPKGRWAAVVDTGMEFTVPYEGDLLAKGMPEMVKFHTVPSIWAFGLEHSSALTIASYPIFKPERFYSDPTRMAEALETHFERSKKRWWTYRPEWTGKLVEVETKPDFKAVKVGGKTFYEPSEVYADTGARVSATQTYYYFTKKRAFVFYSIAEFDKNSEIMKIVESFEPIDSPSNEGELLEKALYLWRLGYLRLYTETSRDRTDFIADYSYEEVTQAFKDAIDENPDNYPAHLFLGIHYLTPKEDFYQTIVAPKVKRIGDAQTVLTNNMLKFDHYRMNQIWVVNTKDVYSYLLHGNFNDVAAIAEFKKALEIKPESYTARYYLSWLYLRTQEYEKAVLEFRKILEKDPQDADALLLLSTAYKALGSEKEADEYYKAFKKVARISTFSDFLDNYFGLALAEALGRSLGEAIGRSISH